MLSLVARRQRFAAMSLVFVAGLAQAEIYKYVDPVTGAVAAPTSFSKGAVRMSTGDIAVGDPDRQQAFAWRGRQVSAPANASACTAAAAVDSSTRRPATAPAARCSLMSSLPERETAQ